jgi:hypothetical protein
MTGGAGLASLFGECRQCLCVALRKKQDDRSQHVAAHVTHHHE